MGKTIGILGGMGPLATADLFRKITLLTDAACGVVHGHDDTDKGKFHSVSFPQMRLWVRAAASESRCTGPLGRGLSNRLR